MWRRRFSEDIEPWRQPMRHIFGAFFKAHGLQATGKRAKRHRRHITPQVTPLESRIALSLYAEPLETHDAPNPQILTFSSDIRTDIDGTINTNNQSPDYSGPYPGQLDDSDGYLMKLNQPFKGVTTVSLTISGAPDAGLVSASTDPFSTPPNVSFAVQALGASGGLLAPTFSATIQPLGDGTDTATITIGKQNLLGRYDYINISQLKIMVIVSGVYSQRVTPAPYTISVIGEPDEAAPPTLPDLAVSQASLSSDGKDVTASYSITGGNLPTSSSISFYWAAGPSFADRIGASPQGVVIDLNATASLATVSLPISRLGTRPANATYILAVVDSPDLAPGINPNGLIHESDEGNNVRAVAVVSPTVTTFFADTVAIHKLLYVYQNLAVTVSVTNNTAQEVTGTELFYLSSNPDASLLNSDTTLLAIGTVHLDLMPGQTANLPQGNGTLTVTIPGAIQPGTYYVKAAFSGDSDPASTMAVSPALTTSVNASGQVSSFAAYPQNATAFDNAVTAVKNGTQAIPVINSIADIESFVESNEAPAAIIYHPYSDVGVPAIGFGSDLEDKTTGTVNTVFKGIIENYLENHPSLPFTFQDFLDRNPAAYIDKATANALFQSGFDTAKAYVDSAYDATNLTLVQYAALIDIAYNIGANGLAKFKSMNADIALGTAYGFACAGLELLNSQRTTQVPQSRSLADFYLLTSSSGVADQL